MLIDIPYHEDNEVIKNIDSIPSLVSRSLHFENVFVTKSKYKTNLAVSKLQGYEDVFYILTNENVKDAIRYYRYRFSAIEFIFKNQTVSIFNQQKYATLKHFKQCMVLLV